LRTLDRAQRIHLAMLSRAFTGDIMIAKQFSLKAPEFIYLAGCAAFFTFIRFVNISEMLGKLILETG